MSCRVSKFNRSPPPVTSFEEVGYVTRSVRLRLFGCRLRCTKKLWTNLDKILWKRSRRSRSGRGLPEFGSGSSSGLLYIKVKVTWFLCVSCVHDTAWTSWPGFTKCQSLDGTTLLLPAEAPAATRRQYLALSKAWQSRWLIDWLIIDLKPPP